MFRAHTRPLDFNKLRTIVCLLGFLISRWGVVRWGVVRWGEGIVWERRWGEVGWFGVLPHFSTMFAFIWRSVLTAGGTHCSWEWTINLTLATEIYLSWDWNPSGEGRVVSKRDALTTRPRRPLSYVKLSLTLLPHLNMACHCSGD